MLLSAGAVLAAVMIFTYAGYPLLVFLIARIFPRRVRRAPYFPFLSVILPVHDEKARLEKKVSSLLSQKYPADRMEIIVVDDGSTDTSVNELTALDAPRVRVVRMVERRGKAAALNSGIETSAGDVVVFTDARQEIAPGSLAALAENFADPTVAAVTGSLKTPPVTADGLFRRYVEHLRSWEAACGSCAGATGALYAVRRRVLAPLPPETILDDLVISLSAARHGRLVFDERAVALETVEATASVWRRRLRTLAGNWQIFLHPQKYRRLYSRRVLVPLVCQKLLRLLFPFFAAGLLAVGMLALPKWTGLSIAAAVVAVVGAVSVKAGRALRPGAAVAGLLVAPVEALLLYLVGSQTVLWAKAETP